MKRFFTFSWLKRFLHSFRLQLTLWFVAILAIILAGFSFFVYYRQNQVLRSETTTRLLTQANQIGGYFHGQPGGGGDHEEPRANAIDTLQTQLPLLGPHDVMALLSTDGQLIQKTDNFQTADLKTILQTWNLASDPAPIISYPLPAASLETGGKKQAYSFIVSSVEYEEGRRELFVLGSPVDPGEQLPKLALALALVFALTLLIAFGGGYWLATRALHPVLTITHTARDIGENDLSRRLRLERADELGELADTFDQMLDRLQAAFERQRRFTADASHELRTPLTIIELEANRALEHRRQSGEYEKSMRIIQAENEWMSRLVNELLTLARMDAGQGVVHREPVDLSELAVDVTERLLPLAQKNHVALLTGALAEALTEGDRVYLSQMLTNLVENGLKYAQGDNAQILVESGRGLRNGRARSWVRVMDNGPGIPPEHVPHLFDRFYRIDEARTREDEDGETITSGSGLGLAIVKSIAEAFGGEIEVQSEIGKWTAFTVWLPGRIS